GGKGDAEQSRTGVLALLVLAALLLLGGITWVAALQGGDTDTALTKSVARITYGGSCCAAAVPLHSSCCAAAALSGAGACSPRSTAATPRTTPSVQRATGTGGTGCGCSSGRWGSTAPQAIGRP